MLFFLCVTFQYPHQHVIKHSYLSVLHSYRYKLDFTPAERARQILSRLESPWMYLYKQIAPVMLLYRTVINVWIESPSQLQSTQNWKKATHVMLMISCLNCRLLKTRPPGSLDSTWIHFKFKCKQTQPKHSLYSLLKTVSCVCTPYIFRQYYNCETSWSPGFESRFYHWDF